MQKMLLAAALMLGSVISANATAVTPGSSVGFAFDITPGGTVGDATFAVTIGNDYTVGHTYVDLNVNASDELSITVDPDSYCGIWNCDYSTTSLVFSGLKFDGGEVLTGFDTIAAEPNYLGYTLLGPDSIAFNFTDGPFYSDGTFLQGTWLTSPAAVPVPAAGLLLLGGLGALAGLRRRKA